MRSDRTSLMPFDASEWARCVAMMVSNVDFDFSHSFRRMMRRFAFGVGALTLSTGGYLLTGDRRRKTLRSVDFYSTALPMYFRYRFEEWRVKDKSEAEKNRAFDALHEIYAPKAYQDILRMRGLYIKLGQIMTTRADFAPPAFMKALDPLQSAVPARPFSEIRESVEQGLGMALDDVFLSIEELPLGAATIGQVHGAVLRNGDRVVLKFQYPEVRAGSI